MNKINELEKRVASIEERNKKVEEDKDWEVSNFRKILLIIFTYLVISFYLNAIEISRPWLNAIVPTIGFFLSTLTLPFFKNFWSKHFYHKRHS